MTYLIDIVIAHYMPQIQKVTKESRILVDLAKSDPGPFFDPNPKEKYGYG